MFLITVGVEIAICFPILVVVLIGSFVRAIPPLPTAAIVSPVPNTAPKAVDPAVNATILALLDESLSFA